MSDNVVTHTTSTPTDATARPENIRYRVVADGEMEVLGPLFARLGWAMPEPGMAKAVVAEAGEGKDALILGFTLVQFVPHNEPMWVHPGMRGTGVAEGLAEAVIHYIEVDCHIKRYLCVAKPGSFAARLAEKHGMRPYPGTLYVKQIE